MKKKLLIIVYSVLLCIQTKAQTPLFFEDENFEIWDSSQGYLNPANWYSLNTLTVFGFEPTLERTTDAHGGNFAVKLQSKDHNVLGELSGVVTTGPLIDANGNADFSKIKIPYTFRPTRFRFYYHADPEPGDSCIMALVLTRKNLALQRIDTVGMALFTVGDSSATYALADIEVVYQSPLPPDSVFIIASSSMDGFNPTPGSTFYLDDIRIIGGSNGLAEPNWLQWGIYPNPAKQFINVESTNKGIITVYDLFGKLMMVQEVNQGSNKFDIHTLNCGIYLVQISDNSGRKESRKLIVE